MSESIAVPQQAENTTFAAEWAKPITGFNRLPEKNMENMSSEKTVSPHDSMLANNPSKGNYLTMWLQFYQSY